MTDSMQNPFSPHKTYVSHGSLYLNVSEYIFHFATSILLFEIFQGKINYFKLNLLLENVELSTFLTEKPPLSLEIFA